jgi:hypothetical protein
VIEPREHGIAPLNSNFVLQVFLPSQSSTQTTSKREIVETTKLLVNILESLGRRQQAHSSTQVDDKAVETFGVVLRLGLWLLRRICDTDLESRVLRSVFYVIASVCLVSELRQFDFDRWNLERSGLKVEPSSTHAVCYACKLLKNASDLIAEPHEGYGDMCVFASVVQKSLSVYQFQLHTIRGTDVAPVCSDSMIESLGGIVKSLNASVGSAEIRDVSRWCCVALLSRLCDSFSADGEKLQALQIAFWNACAVSQSHSESSLWFKATTLSLQSLDTYVDELHPVAARDEFAGVFQVEFRASLLRLKLENTLNQTELREVEDHLNLLLDTINSLVEENRSPLLVWAKGTALMCMSELSHKLRRFEDSIRFADSCYKACRVLIRAAGSCAVDAGPLEEVAGATLLTRTSMRQIDCLKQISHCHLKIGDRLKAAAYAEKALGLACASDENPFIQLGLADFVALSRSSPFSTSNEILCRRLLLVNKALSSCWDLLNEQFQDDLKLCGNHANVISLLGSSVNQELENLFDLEAGTFDLYFAFGD